MHIYNQPRRLTSANCKCEQRGSSELTVSQCTFNSGRWHFCRAIRLSKLPQSHATSLPATLHSVWMPPLLVSNSLGIVTAVHSPGKLFHSPTSGGKRPIANRVPDPDRSRKWIDGSWAFVEGVFCRAAIHRWWLAEVQNTLVLG